MYFIDSTAASESERLKSAEQQLRSALTRLDKVEKENAKLRHELKESRAHFQQQMDAARDKFEKKKQTIREKEKEIDEIKEVARQKMKERTEKMREEVERMKTEHQRQEARNRAEIANLKGKIDAGDEATATARAQNVILVADDVRIPDNPKTMSAGQFGVVHMASFRGCPVAVELVELATLSSYTEALFVAEAHEAAALRHPNLVVLIGFLFTRNHPVVVTEMYESTLRELLAKRALERDEVFRVSCDVAKALNFLHLAKPSAIVHGNICSPAVVLTASQHFRAKLVHTGVATFATKSQSFAMPHAEAYAPPGAGPSTNSDCYSFGVLLCEMCTRRLPIVEQRDKQVASISNKAIRELVVYCLGDDSKKRMPNMSGIIDFLRKLLK